MKTASTPLQNLINGYNFALQLNDSNSYVEVPDQLSLRYTGGEMSMEGWFTIPSSEVDSGYFISKPWNGGGDYNYNIQFNGSRNIVVGLVGNTAFGVTVPSFVLTPDVPHHLALVLGSDKSVVFYVDGVQVLSTSHAISAWNAPPAGVNAISLCLGTLYPYGTGVWSHPDFTMAGRMDSVRMYLRRLSAAEVLAHSQGVFQNERGLIARWEMDENVGVTAFDWSGNGNNGTLVNGPAYVTGIAPNKGQTLVCADLYTWTLRDGTVIRHTSADVNLIIGGNTYLGGPNAPMYERAEISTILGVQVDEMTVTVYANAQDLLAGTAWLAAVQQGKLDGATLLVEQFIADNWAATGLGKMYAFKGRVSQAIADRISAEITLKSPLELLDLKLPRNLYMPGCWHTLYDAGCTLSKAAFTVASAVNDGAPTISSFKTNLTQADDYFSLGSITFTSGPLNGIIRRVASYKNANGLVTVVPPLPSAPLNAGTFSIYPGCDKTQSTCLNKFANLANFGGHPYIPVPETTI